MIPSIETLQLSLELTVSKIAWVKQVKSFLKVSYYVSHPYLVSPFLFYHPYNATGLLIYLYVSLTIRLNEVPSASSRIVTKRR